ncbi:hypothetical protein [Chlamydia caviae]|uniref:Uncharacterized protein n=1 Tax=Chlamydia caviae (strain ATCC VR-813 / DSM 19441 / 03DC25 / GPIC) TaxID=227941 RepID=Q823E5_CHLCV|nr:hypothetical protein [Chlamydia caviae]AAP05219.1 hypothetical protein CCA_00474 [Chlamydia caviae GPIC]
MTSAHEYGAFAWRPSRNVFTLSDLDRRSSTHSQDSRTSKRDSSRTVSIAKPCIERHPKCPMVEHTALWVCLGVAAALSACLLLASGCYSMPTIIAALIIQSILIVASITCLIINYRKEIASLFCGKNEQLC